VHAPIDVATLHALQPLHDACGVSQHTPSTQLPDTHDAPAEQLVPFTIFGAHLFCESQ
jgi:hypothetical protein